MCKKEDNLRDVDIVRIFQALIELLRMILKKED